ncbi:phosphatidylglycerophosphatase A family protein [Marinospirillum insulare]|uniref:Phosphatidylglycerophosphatase A n=1 Tax=Marinospirillum insulare TaxID=217169 RepID=A0ABQ5ZT72_9GAMM|nr:phosphatidylglycerophosphatase A [Marinospirillum insulare]GLR63354.1 phosphatidylglycerophosphatase A [Marinospirillum insulare]
MNKAPASIWRNPVHFLAFGLGSGASPWAPGTAGTLAAVPIYFLLAQLPLAYYLAMLLLTFVMGCWLCGKTSSDLGVHDHGGIVWDEFVGYWLTMLALPVSWSWALAGFVLFRIFDILKPWPIRWIDKKVEGGFGIMLDDVLAAVYAGGLLHLAYYWLN